MFRIEDEWQKRLPKISQILKDSSKISLSGFSQNPGAEPIKLSSEHKTSFKDIVTEFDKKVEEFIVDKIKKEFPHDGFLGEESAYSAKEKASDKTFSDNELVWVLDPIDGTANYSRSYPYFCTTLALLQNFNGKFEVVMGATLDPLRNEFFYAAKGQGAYLNGKRISVSSVDTFERSMFVTGFASERYSQKDVIYSRFVELNKKTMGVRRSGAAALDLAFIACGRLDAYWECGLSSWDVAAGSLLVTEAGGKVSHFERAENWTVWTGEILATNGHMHSKLTTELGQIGR